MPDQPARHQVPWITQYATPSLIAAIAYQGRPAAEDPGWRESGAPDSQAYGRWCTRLCGMACLRMALIARDGHAPTLFTLLSGCLEAGGYVEHSDGSVTGLLSFKQHLAALRPGDTVTLRGPVNKFTLDGAGPQVVMLAQGVGITPLRSMLAHAALTAMAIDSSLIHVADAGHAYRDETQQWATAAAYPQHADDFRAAAAATAHANPGATFFIAGATPFVSSTASLLRGAGVARANIREDKYLGYKPRPRTATMPATPGVVPANA